MASLLQLRDEAFQESTRAHDRLRHELAVFRNEGYSEGTRVGASYALVEESLMPQISTGCLRLVPAFREQISKIHIESDKKAPSVEEVLFLKGLRIGTRCMRRSMTRADGCGRISIGTSSVGTLCRKLGGTL